MAITADARIYFRGDPVHEFIRDYPTIASGVTLYEGGLAGYDASGNLIAVATNKILAGICVEGGTAGDTIPVAVGAGFFVWLTKSNAAATDVGLTGYATDNHTVTTTPNTAIIGPIRDWRTGEVLCEMTLRA